MYVRSGRSLKYCFHHHPLFVRTFVVCLPDSPSIQECQFYTPSTDNATYMDCFSSFSLKTKKNLKISFSSWLIARFSSGVRFPDIIGWTLKVAVRRIHVLPTYQKPSVSSPFWKSRFPCEFELAPWAFANIVEYQWVGELVWRMGRPGQFKPGRLPDTIYPLVLKGSIPRSRNLKHPQI